MSLIRAKDTGPERIVRRLIFRLGYRYRLHVRGMPGCPDIVLPGRRCIIFVHGCFWHGHPGCGRLPKSKLDFWLPKIQANRERDRKTIRELRRQGWRVMVLWECQLRDEAELARRIRRFLDKKQQDESA